MPKDIKEISKLRGKLKAKKRATAMAKRTAKQHEDWDKNYQEKLAKEMKIHL